MSRVAKRPAAVQASGLAKKWRAKGAGKGKRGKAQAAKSPSAWHSPEGAPEPSNAQELAAAAPGLGTPEPAADLAAQLAQLAQRTGVATPLGGTSQPPRMEEPGWEA